jgi:hypothetical protein
MEKFSYRILATFTVSFVLLFSCTKDQVDENVYADSYVHSIFNSSGVPVYAVMHTAYSFQPLTSVSVSGGSAGSVQLPNPSSDTFAFYSVYPASSYKTTVPSPANYTYDVTYETGETIKKADEIVAQSLQPARQLDAVKTSTDIVVSWKAVTNVEAYKLRIYSKDPTTSEKKLIYDSNFMIPKDATSDLSFSISVISLSQYLTTELTFEVTSFIFQEKWDTYHAVSTASIVRFFGI